MENSNSSSGVQIERKSSIENEPRTLNIRQIDFAREAALYVVNTKSLEEALSIFTEGLKPVVGISRQNDEDVKAESDDEAEFLITEIRAHQMPRDIVTAPF